MKAQVRAVMQDKRYKNAWPGWDNIKLNARRVRWNRLILVHVGCEQCIFLALSSRDFTKLECRDASNNFSLSRSSEIYWPAWRAYFDSAVLPWFIIRRAYLRHDVIAAVWPLESRWRLPTTADDNARTRSVRVRVDNIPRCSRGRTGRLPSLVPTPLVVRSLIGLSDASRKSHARAANPRAVNIPVYHPLKLTRSLINS